MRKVFLSISEGVGDRLGRCFELSGKFVMSNSSWNLVHAVISDMNSDSTIVHAWCEKGGIAYDPVLDREFPIEVLYALYGVVDYKYHKFEKRLGTPETYKITYSSGDALKNMADSGHYGPWDKKLWNFKGKIRKR